MTTNNIIERLSKATGCEYKSLKREIDLPLITSKEYFIESVYDGLVEITCYSEKSKEDAYNSLIKKIFKKNRSFSVRYFLSKHNFNEYITQEQLDIRLTLMGY